MNRARWISFILVCILTFTLCTGVAQAIEIAPPENLKVHKVTHDSVALTWSVANGAQGYSIYRASSKNGKFVKIATINDPAVTNFTDYEIYTSGKTYYYKIASYVADNGNGSEVGLQKVVSATPKASGPQTIGAAVNKNNVMIYGERYDADGIVLCKSSSGKSGFKIVKSFRYGTPFTYTENGLKPNTKYYYKLKPYTLGRNGEKMFGKSMLMPIETLDK